jgi:membrane protease YdiL (CAAX protease family)
MMAEVDPMAKIDRGRLSVFLGLLIAAAAAILVISAATGLTPLMLAPAYMFSPLVAGLVVCLWAGVPVSTVGLTIGRVRWLLIAAVIALPLVGVTLALAVAVPGVGVDPSADPVPGIELPPGAVGMLALFGLVLVLGSTVNAIFAVGEEFGWRGYLLWELAPLGFWKASLSIGAIWGVWHAPVILAGYNYPSFPVVGVVAMTLACISFSPVFTYLVVRAESVFAAALLHGVFNGSAGLVLTFAATETARLDELVASPVGLAGMLAFGVTAAGIAISGTPPLTRAFSHGATQTGSVGTSRGTGTHQREQ